MPDVAQSNQNSQKKILFSIRPDDTLTIDGCKSRRREMERKSERSENGRGRSARDFIGGKGVPSAQLSLFTISAREKSHWSIDQLTELMLGVIVQIS